MGRGAGLSVASIEHYRAALSTKLEKLLTLSLGAVHVSPVAERLRAFRDNRTEAVVSAVRTALVAHVYYLDVLPEILACHARLPRGSALIITVPSDMRSVVEPMIASVPAAHIETVANRGRDIAPLLRLLNAGAFDAFDAVLKLHTKKSPHLRDGDIRRKLLFLALAGSRKRVATILQLFEQPSTGLVGWRASWRNSRFFWMRNQPRVTELLARMGVPEPAVPSFFEGSMFWFRPLALASLKRLSLSLEDFEAENGQTDGALHHALERVFASAAGADGFGTVDTFGRALVAQAGA